LIAKLDRLSRDAHFLLGPQKAGVEFTACDMPHADRFTVGIMAISRTERESTSMRTKEVLQAAKARGQKLGNPNGARHLAGRGNGAAVKAVVDQAKQRATGLAATIDAIKAEGITSANGIAAALNARQIATPRATDNWTARSVLNVVAECPKSRGGVT
jgi:DNA invertase Pin-like site-specific DNA recombinase